MKKQLMALFCALTLLVTAVPAAALEGEAQRSADYLATLNLVQGNGGDYALNAPVTRAQAAVLLTRLAGVQKRELQNRPAVTFYDLPDWAAGEIAYAAHQGWINGVSDTAFKPGSTVTANAWCAMLLRMLGYREQDGDFAIHDAAAFAQRIGLVSKGYQGIMSRGDVFQCMKDALVFSYQDREETVVEHLIQQGTCSRSAANALGLLDPSLTARQAADRHMAAVFRLEIYKKQKEVDSQKPSSNSTGFFISPDGLAVTNYHSIENAIHATATLSTGDVYEVQRVVYYDTEIDIAVIQVSNISTQHKRTSAFAWLEMVGTQDIAAGDVVYALGNPLGLGLAASSGIISSTATSASNYKLPCVMSTADISRGSSGGPLLNVYGRVISVTAGAYVNGNSMYLSVPVDPVMKADLTQEGMTLAEVTQLESARARQ